MKRVSKHVPCIRHTEAERERWLCVLHKIILVYVISLVVVVLSVLASI